MVQFAFDELGLTRLQASPLRQNPASRRVLERLGFIVEEGGILEAPLYGGPARLADRYVLMRNFCRA
jgi:RimJ/RimL family protein N-acetyltransferase